MKRKIGLLFLITLLSAALLFAFFPVHVQEFKKNIAPLQTTKRSQIPTFFYKQNDTIETLFKDNHLRPDVIQKVLITLKCAKDYQFSPLPLLTIIDYSLPANEKRLWVFDLNHKKRLFYTYVSHGIKSGTQLTTYFSNKNNSKASSLGVYYIDKAYYGRHGLSLKLDGLEAGFNDNAENRSVVMHGGWYVNEEFIKKYGRPGRSWGCPAVPDSLVKSIIGTIKEQSLLVIYYPEEHWLTQSKFLHCPTADISTLPSTNMATMIEVPETDEMVFFADINKSRNITEHKPILAMSVTDYESVFQTQPPLSRMLRRQVQNTEYIALNDVELEKLAASEEHLSHIHFIIPEMTMSYGYYATEMKPLFLGKITAITGEKVYFDSKPPIKLIATKQFIRWLGL